MLSFRLVRTIGQWGVLSIALGVLVGSACALFLWSLDQVTHLREAHPELLWGLPVAGVFIGWLSLRVGPEVNAGNNLLIREIRQRQQGVPFVMAPFVLVGTLLTHLFGGSAGREGTAVQMGGSIAGALSWFVPEVSEHQIRMLLMAGVSAGFGGVFGTPLAGTIFALEVARLGRVEVRAVLPCLVSAIVSDLVCDAWGIEHTVYSVRSLVPAGAWLSITPLTGQFLFACVVGGLLFGVAARLFAGLTHWVQELFNRLHVPPVLRPALGGVVIIVMVALLGSRDYLGLGVSAVDEKAVTISSSFQWGGVHTWSWWWKLVFTAITLGSGFKGGEATPLFFIGATLGHVLGVWWGLPIDFMAALGFASVFAGATHTPIACAVMAGEMFGGESLIYFIISCVLASLCSGAGVYPAQRENRSAFEQLAEPQ